MLRRYTPLKRTGFKKKSYPWARNPKPPKPMRQVSQRRGVENTAYAKLRKQWLKGKRCEYAGCNSAEVAVHHKRGRIGALLCDTRFWAALCNRHHDWVHANANAARELGLLAPAALWNVSAPAE